MNILESNFSEPPTPATFVQAVQKLAVNSGICDASFIQVRALNGREIMLTFTQAADCPMRVMIGSTKLMPQEEAIELLASVDALLYAVSGCKRPQEVFELMTIFPHPDFKDAKLPSPEAVAEALKD